VNPRAAALIVGIVVVGVVAAAWLITWYLGRRAGVRRREFARMRKERDLMAKALLEIEERADLYRDIDSVLATEVRRVVRELKTDRMETT
jgi:type II secretory pathway pseudopilin PulG